MTDVSLSVYVIIILFQVFKMIQPSLVRDDDVQPFLDAHIQLDLQHIAKCCATSTDDCILLVHDLINKMKGDNIIIIVIVIYLFIDSPIAELLILLICSSVIKQVDCFCRC